MNWKGLIAATFTPMYPDGSVATDTIPAYADKLVADGCTGVYICGSTGEGSSLTSDERMQLAALWVEAAAGRLSVIVQVGHNSLREARLLAAHASEIGADAISATPPSYFPIVELDVLVACMSEIASAAPDMPFYYYHIPMRTNVSCDVADLLQHGKAVIPTLKGVKFSDYRQFDLQRAVDVAGEDMDVFTGVDEMLLGSLSIGVNGAVGTTYNFAAPLYNHIIRSYQNGDHAAARKCQSLAVNMISAVTKSCGSAGFKALMGLLDLDCGPARLPLKWPSGDQMSDMSRRLDSMGFFERLRDATQGD